MSFCINPPWLRHRPALVVCYYCMQGCIVCDVRVSCRAYQPLLRGCPILMQSGRPKLAHLAMFHACRGVRALS
jgi:hypothetical protein